MAKPKGPNRLLGEVSPSCGLYRTPKQLPSFPRLESCGGRKREKANAKQPYSDKTKPKPNRRLYTPLSVHIPTFFDLFGGQVSPSQRNLAPSFPTFFWSFLRPSSPSQRNLTPFFSSSPTIVLLTQTKLVSYPFLVCQVKYWARSVLGSVCLGTGDAGLCQAEESWTANQWRAYLGGSGHLGLLLLLL